MNEALEETTFSFSKDAPQPDRRRQPRHLTILRVGSLVIDGQRELCLIRNISAGGLTAHVYSSHKPGQRVAVELRGEHPVEGEIAWIEGSNIGLTFDEAIDVEEMLAAQTSTLQGWQARLPRVEVDRLGTLRIGARTYPVSSRDISQGGVKLESDVTFEEGQEVVLTLERFRPLKGVVRWYHEGLCGISFNEVIPFHELMRWLRG